MVADKIRYEVAADRLEEITTRLEKGDLTLEEALALFEEGISLARTCSKLLDEAEGKIQVLVKDIYGNIDLEQFDEVREI